jgi:uncharacterized protein YbjT (DUF2867 family)
METNVTSPILVTGGTGTLGRLVTPLLRDAGARIRVLSRHAHESRDGIEYATGDLLKGQGVEPAVDGMATVVHLAGGPRGDVEATRNLVRAASRAGVRHLVLVSVVGADRVPLGYFRMKLGTERAVEDSGIPWTTLRASQFYDLVVLVGRAMAKLPVVPVPSGVRFQPVDARDVAARMAELALGEPAGLVPDIAGPRVYPMGDLLRGYLRAAGKRRLLVPLALPGKGIRALKAGGNLAPHRAVGTRTWEDFLAERVR